MKKYLLFAAVLAAGIVNAQNLPQTAVKPNINTLDTAKWAAVANADKSIKYSAVYDSENLYILSEIAQTGSIYAGDGRGFANYNDGIEIRINRGKQHGYLQLWVDAANQVYTAEKYKPVSKGSITTSSVIIPGKGYRIFTALPWSRLNPDTAKPGNIRVAVIRIKVQKPFKYDRQTIVDTLNPVAESVAVTPSKTTEQNYNNYRVLNFGRSGYSTKEILTQLPVIFDYKPELFILLIGTNDVVYKQKWQTPEQFAEHYRKICEQLKQQKCKVILITLPPCVEDVANKHIKASPAEKAQLNNRIRKMNEYIKGFAGEFNFAILDYHKFFTGDLAGKNSLMLVPATGGGNDGIHPNQAGYKILADELKKIIDKNQYPPNKIICVGDSITYGAHMIGQGSVQGNTYPAQLLKLLDNK
ncbi:MAG: hypothetical protein J6Q81_04325 [Lentisphaeria bacterium]|nr:hypothetical protein [Lentisphaeria bacterium]